MEREDTDENGLNLYAAFVLDAKLLSYKDILPTCDFDATQFDAQAELEHLVLFALDEMGLIEEFRLNAAKLGTFVHSIAKLYRQNPFHNWQHGFSVFQFVLYLLRLEGAVVGVLPRTHVLAILVAAMCHDVDHPGNDNLFEI